MRIHLLPSGALLLSGALQAQQTYHLQPTGDAVVGIHPGYPTAGNNYGYADHFSCTSQPGAQGGENNARSLMAFDLSMIDVGSILDSARLDLFGRGATDGTGASTSVGNNGVNTCYLERVTEAWTENGVTWNNQPETTPLNAVTLPQSTATIQDYLGIDVTTLVQDMINDPANAHGFCLRLVVEDVTRGMYFCSTDFSDPDKHPILHVYVKEDVSIWEGTAAPLELDISPSLAAVGEPLRFTCEGARLAASLRMFDATGRLVLERTVDGDRMIIIGTSGLLPGAYQVAAIDRQGHTIGIGRSVLR